MMRMNPITKSLNAISKPCSAPPNKVLVTELATAILYNQWGCFDMNRVVNCNPLILFFSNNTTQLCSTPPHKVHALNGLRDMAMNTVTYTTKKGIKPLTLNHLVEGSSPSRPIDSTAIEDFTLDRSLDRQENHLEVNQNQTKVSQAEQNKELYPELEQLTKNQLFQREKFYQGNRDSMIKTAGVASAIPLAVAYGNKRPRKSDKDCPLPQITRRKLWDGHREAG